MRTHPYARTFVVVLIALWSATSPGFAQQAAVSFVMPLSGLADLGGTFNGTFTIRDFRVQDDAVVARGVAAGVLSDASGSVRNIVVPLSLPLDTATSQARLSTDISLATVDCSVLPLDFDTTVVNVRGATIAFQPSSLEIAAPEADTPTRPGTVTSFGAQAGRAMTPAVDSAAADVLCRAVELQESTDHARLAQALNQVLASF